MNTTLVIGLSDDVTPEDAQRMGDEIRNQHPDLRILVVSGVTALAVVPEAGDPS